MQGPERSLHRAARLCCTQGKQACTRELWAGAPPFETELAACCTVPCKELISVHTACAQADPDVVSMQYAFNLFSHNSPMQDNGYNEEENKMIKETHKIWDTHDVGVTATCIRVPVMRTHAESINLEFERPLSEQEVSSLWHRYPCSSTPPCGVLDYMSAQARLHLPLPSMLAPQAPVAPAADCMLCAGHRVSCAGSRRHHTG